MKLEVEKAAIRSDYNDIIYSLDRPARHHDIIGYMATVERLPTPITGEQGFILNNGEFVSRIEARLVAENAGQLLPNAIPSCRLYSEDVW